MNNSIKTAKQPILQGYWNRKICKRRRPKNKLNKESKRNQNKENEYQKWKKEISIIAPKIIESHLNQNSMEIVKDKFILQSSIRSQGSIGVQKCQVIGIGNSIDNAFKSSLNNNIWYGDLNKFHTSGTPKKMSSNYNLKYFHELLKLGKITRILKN